MKAYSTEFSLVNPAQRNKSAAKNSPDWCESADKFIGEFCFVTMDSGFLFCTRRLRVNNSKELFFSAHGQFELNWIRAERELVSYTLPTLFLKAYAKSINL